MSASPPIPDRKFGTAPVFLTAISTILGAVMFLRFGYAVAHVGFYGVLVIILIGHLVTIPTAMAIAEIATNQRVQGGGEYYIISRSFGLVIGAAIGIALYLSQAISVAFYSIAFAQAFEPVFAWINERTGLALADKRLVSLPAVLIVTALIVTKGAQLGVKVLYLVVGTLLVSLLMFFLGSTDYDATHGAKALTETLSQSHSLFFVFAICFPAFTGMTAGVGLSGDLRDPKTSIPRGTLWATVIGMVVYVAIAWKLAVSASPAELAGDQLIMTKIALWGPIIPIGLACATISSAIGSFLVAPRTLQAIALDKLLPYPPLANWLARSRAGSREPFNAALLTGAIAVIFVLLGDVDFVAQIISMFFMVTYGSICSISFLEHLAADPSYRPGFRSRWYISLLGAVLCIWLMFQMNTAYAWLSIVAMLGVYLTVSRLHPDKAGLARIFQGVMFQVSRQIRILVQRTRKDEESWRPSVVCISENSFRRHAAFDLLRWISHRYGFGTYIHFIQGYVSSETHERAQQALARMVSLIDVSGSRVFVDTMVSPSYTTAISQLIQLPGISGKENNTVLFEFSKDEPEELERILENFPLVAAMGFDICVLGFAERGFGYRSQVHVWLTPYDYENANLMILLAYVLLGHPEWNRAVIKIFSVLDRDSLEGEREALFKLIQDGRLPISANNVEVIPRETGGDIKSIVAERSSEADLVILGIVGDAADRGRTEFFRGYEAIGNVLFVFTRKEIAISEDEALQAVAPEPTKKDGENGGAAPALPSARPNPERSSGEQATARRSR